MEQFSENTFLDRKQASAYLQAKYRVGAVGTLAKAATVGGGPAYRKIGKRVVYTRDDLDAWARERMTEPMRSSSEYARTA